MYLICKEHGPWPTDFAAGHCNNAACGPLLTLTVPSSAAVQLSHRRSFRMNFSGIVRARSRRCIDDAGQLLHRRVVLVLSQSRIFPLVLKRVWRQNVLDSHFRRENLCSRHSDFYWAASYWEK